MQKLKTTMQGWKPVMYSMTVLATFVLAAGAKWRPH